MQTKKTLLLILGGLVLVGGLIYVFRYPLSSALYAILPSVASTPLPTPTGTEHLSVPSGFTSHIFSNDTPGARVLALDPKGALAVSLNGGGGKGLGSVVLLPDIDSNGIADKTVSLISGLTNPHGIIFRCPNTGNTSADQDACSLYVAETAQLTEYAYDADTMTATFKKKILDLPPTGAHTTRSLLLQPDGIHMLIAVGSTCNVCAEEDPMRSALTEVNLETLVAVPYAKGLRNTVFMALNPVTGDVWGTENGRDLLGDDIPPDEVNILKRGGNYGWPICYGNNIHDIDYDKNTYIRNPCMEPFETPAYIEIQAHSAPLGIAFIPEEGWPENMGNDILVAYHGSWNRSTPTGYKIVRFDYSAAKNYLGEATDFMTGFITAEHKVLGRPTGLLTLPGGTLYVADDGAGVIYKVTRTSLD